MRAAVAAAGLFLLYAAGTAAFAPGMMLRGCSLSGVVRLERHGALSRRGMWGVGGGRRGHVMAAAEGSVRRSASPYSGLATPPLNATFTDTEGLSWTENFTPAPDRNKNPAIIPTKRYASSDWHHNLISLPFSVTLARIRSHLLANTLLAVAVTNSAYDRFWEARKTWGGMIAKLREIARMAHSSMYGWDREHILQLTGAFAPVLLQHLRTGAGGKGSDGQKEALKGLLSESDVEIIWSARNRPYTMIKMLGAIIRKAYTNTNRIAQHFKLEDRGANLTRFECSVIAADLQVERAHAEHMLTGLTEYQGAAERIVKTSVPLSYSRHTSRFLSVWCFTLPFVLVEAFKWRMIPAVVGICWALLCIEEVGNIIEDPFNMPFIMDVPMQDELKLERSFKNIRSDIMDRLPAVSPFLQHYGGDFLCYKDYDVGEFHEKQRVTRGRSNYQQSVTDAATKFVWQDMSGADCPIDPPANSTDTDCEPVLKIID